MKRTFLGLLALSIIAINFLIVMPVWATPSSNDCSKMGGTWRASSDGWHCDGAKSSAAWSAGPSPSQSNCSAFGGTWSAGSDGWHCHNATFSGTWTTGSKTVVSTSTYYESETNQQYSRSCVETKYSDGSYTYIVYKPQAAGSGGSPVESGNGQCPSSFSHQANTGGTGGSNGSDGSNDSNAAGGGGSVSVTAGVVSHSSGGSAGECYAGDTKITFAILPIEGDHVDCKDAIFQALGIGLSILTWGVSIGATIGFVITAYQYITAGSNVAQVQKAKMRMVQIVIGIVFYATFWGVMNWLLPGGLFGDGSI